MTIFNKQDTFDPHLEIGYELQIVHELQQENNMAKYKIPQDAPHAEVIEFLAIYAKIKDESFEVNDVVAHYTMQKFEEWRTDKTHKSTEA